MQTSLKEAITSKVPFMVEVKATSVCYIKIIIYRTMTRFHIELWILQYTHNALVIPDNDNYVTEARVGLTDDEILCIIATTQKNPTNNK